MKPPTTCKAMSIDTYTNLNVINKYPSGQAGTDPVIIVRLAEMYLISAEAQGLTGLNRLNQLRAARNLSALNPATVEEYQQAVALERRRELLAEEISLVRPRTYRQGRGCAGHRMVPAEIPHTRL